MDTNRIKRFATEARNILKAGIAAKITTLGFDRNGHVAEENKPLLMQGGSVWNGQLQTEGFYYQWMSLYNRIQQKGISEVYEEAAYTWFNRLCAIRILQKNNLCSPVLAYADAARTPVIVDEARQGRIPQMKEELRQRLVELLDDDTKVTEQFAILVTAWCHDNPIINQCFGSIADYTELLLPNNILAEGGFVDMLNHTEFITDEDFQSPELIGWLYQFYISERKDEVFAKKGKFEADEIPAATQIFTPNWIVKYMVQNTVGRIYLDNNPYETQLQKKWQYIVGDVSHVATAGMPTSPLCGEKTSSLCGETPHLLHYDELTDLKVADLACGSGHILNECFDLLYDLYIAEGYGRSEAVENIFCHNLTGIDLDTRAKQLSQFALLLKACQKDAAFADAHILPHVMDMAHVSPKMDETALSEACLKFMGGYEDMAGEMLAEDFELLKEAEDLGSIMKFNDDEDYLAMLRYHYEDWTEEGIDDCPDEIKALIPGVQVILALTEKYHALVMNPPYMGSGNMNSTLSKYVKDNYKDGKADLFSVFMQMGMEHLVDGGKMAQINMQSWMFLSSFEKLRTQFLKDYNIDNMLHLGPRTFDELSGEVVQNTAFVLSNHEPTEQGGVYYRLVDGKNCADKERLFLEAKQGDGKAIINSKLYPINYPNVEQKNFEKIPGAPIGYWVSPKIQEIFTSNLALSAVCSPTQGLATADNARFLRLWFEPSYSRIQFGCENAALAARSQKKWFPTTKGGTFRRWFGNMYYVVNWENDGEELTNFKGSVIRNRWRYFTKCGATWSTIASGKPSFRYFDKSWLFETKGSVCFPEDDKKNNIIMGYLNSPLVSAFLQTLAPTLDYHEGPMGRIPYIDIEDSNLSDLVEKNIALSKSDWDAHETSWDFQRNELLSSVGDVSHVAAANSDASLPLCGETPHPLQSLVGDVSHVATSSSETGHPLCGETPHPLSYSLKDLMEQYKTKWERKFMQLHKNEEELNRQFIDIYGLQDELTPDVPLNEITILQQGEISIE